MSIDATQFKEIMSHWASGISVITTVHEGEHQGFTANSFASVSIDPLLISMSVAKSMYAGELLLKSRVFTVNILTEEQIELGKRFAGFFDMEDRFAGLNTSTSANGCYTLPGILGYLNCEVYETLDVGASTLVLGKVTEGSLHTEHKPLIYFNRQWGSFIAK